MANTFGKARMTSLVNLPVASATVVDAGDECYWDKSANEIKPLSSQADNAGEEDNQAEAAQNYLGRAWEASPSGQTRNINVDIGREVLVYERTVPSGTYRFGSLLGPSENSDGDGLEDQQLEAVTSEDVATHVVMDDDSSARTTVLVSPIRTAAQPLLQRRYQANRATLTGNLTLTFDSPRIQSLDPGGANRDVTLPADEESAGLFFLFANRSDVTGTGDETLVLKDDAAATKATISKSQVGIAFHDGTAWFAGILPQT